MAIAAADQVNQCLRLLTAGVKHRKRQDDETAGRAFAAALLVSQTMPAAEGGDLRALALYNLSLMFLRRGRKEEARKLREQAGASLSTSGEGAPVPASLLPLFHELMADVLTEVCEHRRAIPHCEASIQHLVNFDDPVAIGEVLGRAARCYLRTGLRDHAAVPLRAAAKIFRGLAGDPRLPAILLDLGNALRKVSPEETERCYLEAAEFHVAKAQLESAAPAWVNLGVLCSEQGRYAEALAHYEKALRVREQSSGTPPERIGILLNNMANVYRRMEQFEEAHRTLDRALPFLEPTGGHYLACGYGTRGLIFRDQGRDEEAVEWFRRSTVEHEKSPSPNLDTLSEELDNEAAALDRLGRTDEAKHARGHAESVRAAMAGIKAADCELGDLKPPADGAVMVEIEFGIRHGTAQGNSDPIQIGRRLAGVLTQEIGYLGGHVVIPETTTLMFYGADAEALFLVLQPYLIEEPMFRGARVTVRQGVQHREVVVPRQVM